MGATGDKPSKEAGPAPPPGSGKRPAADLTRLVEPGLAGPPELTGLRRTWARLRRLLFGRAYNLFDPRVFQHVSLVAFLAWVGLGSDGLSSSAYGPEEAFLALGDHRYLALILAMATAVTVFVISASYQQIIELFPTGGGGYLVASKLLGPGPGLVAGCALVVDYILTIAISVASGADAIFSFLPPALLPFKLPFACTVVILLITLNLRGVRESVLVLLPVFLGFVVLHVGLILYGLGTHAERLPDVVTGAYSDSVRTAQELGVLGLAALVLRAYSLGAGTYTGIEAVSNGLPILREPRVETGKRTMRLMALSLAFVAGGILVNYLINDVRPRPGMTLNAVLVEGLVQGWGSLGPLVFLLTLLSEAALLFVAAQTGFLGGPRVLASMAVDSWMPHQFAQLSDRLVTKNGVLLMGVAAFVTILGTAGSVRLLVVLYSINVFVTFSLSLLGTSVHWWQERRADPRWRQRLTVSGIGLLLTGTILGIMLVLKFEEGGWVTVLLTSGLIAACLRIRRHYNQVARVLRGVDEILLQIPFPVAAKGIPDADPKKPTAAIFVSGYNGLGVHTLLNIPRLFGEHFQNFTFISVGVVDSHRFKGVREIANLRRTVEADLKRYVELAHRLGVRANYRFAIGTDVLDEAEQLAQEQMKEMPRSVFFTAKLIFPEETPLTRWLHSQTPVLLQRRLQFAGFSMVILPVRVTV
ncbi:MAG: APC family permease [Deltaproteobacteria bacterium]|nr:APC family permease [Deltaproteobacteria bacterium]